MEGILSHSAELYNAAFQPLEIHRKALKTSGYYYRVYKNPDDFEELEAQSAYEALRSCQVKVPYKVLRRVIKDQSSISRDMLVDMEEIVPSVAQTIPEPAVMTNPRIQAKPEEEAAGT